MTKSKTNDRIAAYVGISSPETPKYLLANNFLLEYFQPSNQLFQSYDYDWFESRKILHTQDEENKVKLKASFNRFLYRYLGDETIHDENRRLDKSSHFFFPLTQNMLVEGNTTLRHMLYHLQTLDDDFNYEEIQEYLADYIFRDSMGINAIWKVLFQEDANNIRWRRREDPSENDFWTMLKPAEKTRLKRLGQRLNEDLYTLLTHEYFKRLDFYRRYQYLSMLLTSYVIQYIVTRKGPNEYMLCKGSSLDGKLNGSVHRACCYNYARLREIFPEWLQKYYEEAFQEIVGEEQSILLVAHDGDVWIGESTLEDFTKKLSGRRGNLGISYDKLLKGFRLEDGGKRSMPVKEFVWSYISLTGSKQGSSLKKISSVLSTSGKQIDMVYPKSNVNQKYFAMSESLTEFYVRLYLATQRRQYDYLDNFMEFLQERYHIVIAKTSASEKLIKQVRPILSTQDFGKNKQAFLETLNGNNCLIKLSDSGFIVTLPEEKGGFKLI